MFATENLWDKTWDNFDTLIHVVMILLAAVIIRAIVRRVLNHSLKKLARASQANVINKSVQSGELQVLQEQRLRTIESVLQSFASLAIWTVAGLAIVLVTFPQLGPLLAGVTVIGGAAFGLGAQSFVKDVLAGLIMLVEGQYAIGDTVDLGEASGTVQDVGLRTTRLRAEDGTLWYIPNGEIKRVGNSTQAKSS